MELYYLVYLVLLALGILAGAIRYVRLATSSRYFFFLIIVTLITESVAWYMGDNQHSNLIVYRLLVPVQYALITFGYHCELPRFGWVAIVSVAFITGLWLFDWIQTANWLDK